MPRRALCIHAHFYQPSREDPYSGIIPQEQGAEPFKNWNEKINANCYAPNARLGNFEKISFNLGPTLTRWMEQNAQDTLALITESERRYKNRTETVNAMAQAYHHTILPLASLRDKRTQVHWGIADYIHTYGFAPEGMWLPETAVDEETLSVLAENDIRYTILAPWQAEGEVDVTQPYRVELPGGRSMAVFFYHSGLSTGISFNAETTTNADLFIQNSLKNVYSPDGDHDQLILLASDGELYGHHQPFRDLFLSYLLDGALTQSGIEYTTPAKWLREHPPVKTIRIRNNTSWSCMEGVERWRGECACTPNSAWKKPLRDLMNQVAELVDANYLDCTSQWLRDPWRARDEYISVLLGDVSFAAWLDEECRIILNPQQVNQLQYLMAAQFERQRMFTSCGWFFEDFDRIEPRNNVQYAAHAISLSEAVSGKELRSALLPALGAVKSWRSGITAREVFDGAMLRFKENLLA
jgi:alpha-amylase/alpha-mannosidase (GH57 family)